ncbi:MAG: hypothetical protein R3326_07485 [Gemmatimonadota bacterium]|nr:hypothetical protein [Gemmatimonadota bacterium]
MTTSPSTPIHRWLPILGVIALLAPGCRADVWVETPDERLEAEADTAPLEPVVVDTVYRPMPIDSVAASFAWLVERPAPRVTTNRTYPDGAVDAARQFLRALAQTGRGRVGLVGTGEQGYERAFTYVHPRVRGRRSSERWSRLLGGIVRPAVVQLEPVPDDSTKVFAEILVLKDVDGESVLGLYYGHLSALPGDNGWQVTGARLMSEDWQAPLGDVQPWRYDRGGAAGAYALENPAYALEMIRVQSGEWVPLARPVPVAHLRFGLPDPR